jgi:enterochelin esterase-like enzyme
LLGLLLGLAPVHATDVGRVVDMPIRSAFLQPQHIRIWLPPGYDDQNEQRYGVVYLHDGQYAFQGDQKDGESFAIDASLIRLSEAGRIDPVIVVAIPHAFQDRFRQDLPDVIYQGTTGDLRAMLDKELAGRPVTSTAFLNFLTRELKPAIDATYRTRTDARHTTMLGASMAGLITAAAFIQYPELFGRAACISPQWPLYDKSMKDYPSLLRAWPAYFARVGPPTTGRKLWLDHGTTMIDAGFGPYQEAIARQLETMGWRRGANIEARVHEGGAHDWAAWAAHMDELLAWLLN